MNNRLLFLGDIHGQYHIISNKLKLYDITDANIIQVGDFGIGFMTFEKEKNLLEKVNSDLKLRNVSLYAIRGNHDYKPYFDSDPFGFSNIKLLKDYSVLNISNKKILFIGGAISIDRIHRITKNHNNQNKCWWGDESFELEEDKLIDLEDLDIVVTHTAPSFCYPDNTNGFGHLVDSYAYEDSMLKTDLHTERYLMNRAFGIIKNNNKITNHYYGHFHNSKISEVDGIKHRLLDVNELYEEYGK